MGAGLLRTRFMLGLILHPGVELPQSRRILVRTGLPQMLVQLGPVPPGARLSSDGAFSSQKEVAESLMSSPAGPVPYRVHATVDNILSAGSSENQTQHDQTLSSDRTPAMRTGPTASHQSCPAGPSPLGELATMDKLRSARLSRTAWISTVALFGLLMGMDQPGDPVGPALNSTRLRGV